MLHRGNAHTYGLEGNFGILYGASIVWFALSLVLGLPSIVAAPQFALIPFVCGISISWLLGLGALAHRRRALRLFMLESLVLVASVLASLFVFW